MSTSDEFDQIVATQLESRATYRAGAVIAFVLFGVPCLIVLAWVWAWLIEGLPWPELAGLWL